MENIEKLNTFLFYLLDNSKDIQYIKKSSEEFIVFSIEKQKISLNNVQGNYININIKEKDSLKESSLVCSYLDIKDFLDILIKKMEKNYNKNEIEILGESLYEKTIQLIKSVLKNEKISDEMKLKINGIGDNQKIEIINKDINYVMRLGANATTINNKINTILGCMELYYTIEITSEIKPKYIQNIENSNKSYTIGILIPGYELKNYPLLQEYIKLPVTHHHINEWFKDLQKFTDSEFKSALNYSSLSVELNTNEKNIDKKKNKI